jgi:hypothetical protein
MELETKREKIQKNVVFGVSKGTNFKCMRINERSPTKINLDTTMKLKRLKV